MQPKSTTQMKIYSVKIDKELSDKIAQIARDDDRSESSVIRQAIRAFLSTKQCNQNQLKSYKKSVNCIADDVVKKGA